VSFIVCVVLCAVFRLIVVLICVMCAICVLCLIVVPLPPGKNPFTVEISNNNIIIIKNYRKALIQPFKINYGTSWRL
jgi:hypothetical protein